MKLYINSLTIKIEYSFVLIIAFALLVGNYNVLYVLLFSSLHEMGHLALLYALGGRADSIAIAYYGIGLKHSSKLTTAREIFFLLGGIMVNLFFVVINFKREINLALLLINALPIYPLDGGRIFKLVLGSMLSFEWSQKIYTFISVIIICLLIVFAIVQRNASLIVITIYLIVYSINNYSN